MGALRNERTVRGRRPVCLGARRRNACPSGPCLCTGAWPNIARLPDGGSACCLPFPERSCYAQSRDKSRRQPPFRSCGIPAKRRTIRLPAASLLEAVVASVVLLIVFAASLETVVRLTATPSEGMACVDADYRAACTASEIRQGAFSEGTTERSYGWGTLTVLIEPYASCPALWQATLTVKITGGRKRMEYRHLVDPDGFDRNTIIDEVRTILKNAEKE